MERLSLDALMGHLVSFVSYRVVSICLLSVPFTHFMGLYLRFPKTSQHWKYWLFPFKGGNRHIVLQLISWLLWGFSLLTFLPVALTMLPGSYAVKDLPTIPRTHVDVVSGAAACISFIGELLMIKAILVFDDNQGTDQAGKEPTRFPKPQPVLASAFVVIMGLLLSVTGALLLMALDYLPDIASRVLYCCLSLSCLLIASSTTYGLGGFLRYGSNKASTDDAMWQFFQPFSGGTTFVATQAISWSIFAATVVTMVVLIQQLVAGVAHCFRCWAIGAGTCMVAAQAMLGISLLLFRTSPKSTAAKLMRAAGQTLSLSGSGTAGEASQQGWLGANLPIILMYSPVHLFFTLGVLSFSFMPLKVAVALWVAYLLPYYLYTHIGNPAHTGSRHWPWLMNWFAKNIEGSLEHWFGSLTVVYDGDATAELLQAAVQPDTIGVLQDSSSQTADAHQEATSTPKVEQQQQQQQEKEGSDEVQKGQKDSVVCNDSSCTASDREKISMETSSVSDSKASVDSVDGVRALSADDQQLGSQSQHPQQEQTANTAQKYIIGFQPHGLYPTGAGFLPWMPSFRQHFPQLTPVTLTATVLFFTPFIRDICCWAGFRQVSKHTFLSALREKGSVVFCPGGQTELLHAWKAFLPGSRKTVVLHTRHKGFCRIAIEQNAALVPVLAIGENLQLKNMVNVPSLQQATYKRIGFPVPFILSGRWWFTPFPRKTPLVYVIGRSLQPPAHVPGQHVESAAVDELHKQYYDSLVNLFERYKHLHPDFKEARIVLSDV